MISILFVAACTTSTDDGRDDAFLSNGKADGSIAEGSPEAIGVLAVVNTLTRTQLDDDVGLTASAAMGITEHRDGADGVPGTADDNPFDSLQELDDVPYVGPHSFAALLAYAQTHGYVHAGDASWQLENPLPDDRKRTAVWSIAPDDVWAVGAEGLVEHWDGGAWHDVASGYTGTLNSVWAAGANDVWIVGQGGTVLHWTGSAFTQLDAQTTRDLFDVHGTGPSDVWIGGTDVVVHYNGASFTNMTPSDCGQIHAVFAASPTDVWVGDSNAGVCQFDGTRWNFRPFNTSNAGFITDLVRSSNGTVWAASVGQIWRYDGSSWTHAYSLPSVAGSGLVPSISHFAAFGDNDIWASGTHGFVAHWDGSTWTPTRIPGNAWYVSIAGSGSSAWAVGTAARARLDAGSWTETYQVVTSQWLISMEGTSSSNLWSIGSMADLVHRTVDGWSAVPTPLTADDMPKGVFAAADDDLWIVGQYKSAHWDGHAFTLHPELTRMWGAWGASPSDVWAVGEGKLAHFDGATWAPLTSAGVFNLYGVAGTSATDVWAVGGAAILHYDGAAWTKSDSASDVTTWTKVVAIAPDDVWVCGHSQSVLHWDGTTWTALTASTTAQPWLRDAWAAGHDDVWFVESGNALVHWNGTAFDRTEMAGASSVFGFPGNGLWATGDDGAIHRRAL